MNKKNGLFQDVSVLLNCDPLKKTMLNCIEILKMLIVSHYDPR